MSSALSSSISTTSTSSSSFVSFNILVGGAMSDSTGVVLIVIVTDEAVGVILVVMVTGEAVGVSVEFVGVDVSPLVNVVLLGGVTDSTIGFGFEVEMRCKLEDVLFDWIFDKVTLPSIDSPSSITSYAKR